MRFGIYTDYKNAAVVKEIGFDYIELALNKVGTMDEEEYLKCKESLRVAGIKSEVLCLLLPKTLNVVNKSVYDEEALLSYLDLAFTRAKELGCEIAVFGSGKSRTILEGSTYIESYKMLVSVTTLIVKKAKEYGITIVIEPLNRSETNMIHSLCEGAVLASLTGAELLADAFHMRKEGESMSDIALVGKLTHTHIAMLDGRKYPLSVNEEVLEFMHYLKAIDYNSRLSIEAKTEDFVVDATKALECLKESYKEG